jgi:hypothetical protein
MGDAGFGMNRSSTDVERRECKWQRIPEWNVSAKRTAGSGAEIQPHEILVGDSKHLRRLGQKIDRGSGRFPPARTRRPAGLSGCGHK